MSTAGDSDWELLAGDSEPGSPVKVATVDGTNFDADLLTLATSGAASGSTTAPLKEDAQGSAPGLQEGPEEQADSDADTLSCGPDVSAMRQEYLAAAQESDSEGSDMSTQSEYEVEDSYMDMGEGNEPESPAPVRVTFVAAPTDDHGAQFVEARIVFADALQCQAQPAATALAGDRVYNAGTAQLKDPLTLLLLGKTGNGKSSTGNTILGRKAFPARRSAGSVTTCNQAENTLVNGRTVTVIDTPGVFDTAASVEEVTARVREAMQLAGPGGVHAVLLVLSSAARWTAEECAGLAALRGVLGPRLLRHTVAVFTHGDGLEEDDLPLADFLADCPPTLQAVLDEVEGRHLLFNNRAAGSAREGQVAGLLRMVDDLVAARCGAPLPPPPSPSSDQSKQDAVMADYEPSRARSGEAAHRAQERRARAARSRRGVLLAGAVGGLLGMKVLSLCLPSHRRDAAKGIQINLRGQVTWSFEPPEHDVTCQAVEAATAALSSLAAVQVVPVRSN